MRNENSKSIPIVGIFGQYVGEDEQSCYLPLKADSEGKLHVNTPQNFDTKGRLLVDAGLTFDSNGRLLVRERQYRTVLKESVVLDLGVKRERELLIDKIDGFTVFDISGECTLYLDAPVTEKQIPVNKSFSFSVTAERVYISNAAQMGCTVVLLFESIEEVA